MSVQYHDPRAEPMTAPEPYTLSASLEGPVVIGLLANGFPDSVNFLIQVGDVLAERLPEATFKHYDKGEASRIVSGEMLEEIVADCDAVVAAYGH